MNDVDASHAQDKQESAGCMHHFFWKVSRKDWLGNFPETLKVSGNVPPTLAVVHWVSDTQ